MFLRTTIEEVPVEDKSYLILEQGLREFKSAQKDFAISCDGNEEILKELGFEFGESENMLAVSSTDILI